MKKRYGLIELIKNRHYKIIVEVGVYTGNFSLILLEPLYDVIDKFHAIDPWINENGTFNNNIYNKFIGKTAPYAGKLNVIKNFSVDASKQFEDNSIDLIFIDADHSYESAKEDIGVWYPKVRSGGILSGHDYLNDKFARCKAFGSDRGKCEVKKAVDEFVNGKSLKLNVSECGDCWWVEK